LTALLLHVGRLPGQAVHRRLELRQLPEHPLPAIDSRSCIRVKK
jgi:hypothetical protein